MKGRNTKKTLKISAILLAFVLMFAVCTVSFATETNVTETPESTVSPWFVCILGVSTVFIGLFALILITKLMSFLYGAFGKKEAAPTAKAVQTAETSTEDRKLLDAVIASTIATYMGTDVKGLRINSIKKI